MSFACWIKSNTPRPVLTTYRTGFSSLRPLHCHFHSAIYSVCHCTNLSFRHNGNAALSPPVPKVNPPHTCSDYRPIFITPILARLMKNQSLKTTSILLSCILTTAICFKISSPSDLPVPPPLHSSISLTDLLQTHYYVHVIALDFSKAFDSVRH